MADTLAPETPAPARRKWRRRFAGGTLALAAGLAALAWFAPAIATRTALRDRMMREATAGTLDGTVTAETVSAAWLSPVELRGVRVTDSAGNLVAVVESVTTSKTLLELARNPADLGVVTVTGPAVTLVCDPAGSNLERVLAPLLNGSSKPGGSRPAIEVRVAGGSAVVRDAETGTEAKFDAIEATAVVPAAATDPIRLTAAGTHASGRVDATVSLGPTSTAKFEVAGFRAAAVAPLVRRFATAEFAGTVTAAGSVTWGADASGKLDASADAKVEVRDLDLAAAWLGPDRVRFASVVVPVKATVSGSVVRVEKADLTCDAGTASAAGVIDLAAPVSAALSRPGQRVTADVNLAKIAEKFPKLTRLRDGTAVESGSVGLDVSTTADGKGWAGHVRTTALRGTRDGKPLAWDRPFRAEFAGRVGADGLTEFDTLVCQSDFVGLAAKGTIDRFQVRANLNLDKLSAHLGEFVDLGGLTLTGTAVADLTAAPQVGKSGSAVGGTVTFTRLMVKRGPAFGWEDPTLTLKLAAAIGRGPAGEVRVESADATVAAAGDELRVALLDPVPDARMLATARAAAKLTGDLNRWRWRANAVVPLPKEWLIAGTGTVAADVRLGPDAVGLDNIAADLTGVKFVAKSLSLNVDERAVKATATAAIARKSGEIVVSDTRVSCETLGGVARTITLTPTAAGDYAVVGSANVTADALRVQRTLGVVLDPPTTGTAKGTVGFDVKPTGAVGFDVNLAVEKLTVGPPAKPLWSEPTAKVVATGTWDPAADGVTFTAARVERDGLTADAKGSLTKLSSPAMAVNLDGTLAYDLAKIEPQLRAYLGAGASATGKDARPFRLSGTLGSGGQNLTAAVDSPKKPGPYDALSGSAGVAWQSVRAYGFEVGPAELRADLDRGKVAFTPVSATFGGGKVKLAPAIDLTPAATILSFAPGKVVENAKLTPAACASALGYVLPPIANVGQADGTISFDLAESRVPLGDPDKAALKGTLTVHSATVSAGPFVTEIATLLGVKSAAVTLAKDQAIPVRVADGRVYHENFVLKAGDFTVRSAGSVGLDGGVSMVLDIPVPANVAQQLFPKNPRIRDALAKQSVKVPVGGTLGKPQLDAKAFRAATAKLIEDATKQAAKDALGDLFKK